jgi:hypothetical protein
MNRSRSMLLSDTTDPVHDAVDDYLVKGFQGVAADPRQKFIAASNLHLAPAPRWTLLPTLWPFAATITTVIIQFIQLSSSTCFDASS